MDDLHDLSDQPISNATKMNNNKLKPSKLESVA